MLTAYLRGNKIFEHGRGDDRQKHLVAQEYRVRNNNQ